MVKHMTDSPSPQRVVLAKVGLDGHDRGVKVVARALRDAGMHVIYAGLWQTPEAVVRTVAEEDADWLGLSLLSGAHMTLVPRVLELLRETRQGDVGLVVGGIIPERDIPALKEMGVRGIFGPGTSLPDIVAFLKAQAPRSGQVAELQARLRSGDRLALARLLSLAARGEHLDELTAAFGQVARHVPVIAITGSAGVGKSTLVGRLVDRLRQNDKRVAVLACDPQSPVTGGALLGDRFRMPLKADDDGVFVRSLATASGRGTVAAHLDLLLNILQSATFDLILVETVGAGQGDTGISDLADQVCLLLQPETGDELQWEKAGLLEVADVVVVHKADLPTASLVEEQVRASLELSTTGQSIPVLKVSARTGEGLDTLVQHLTQIRE